jgi:ubiquitin C-terminal hydrolase
MILFPNLGNTCYCSSVLQCFIYNQDFINTIINNNTNNDLISELNNIINNNTDNNTKEYSLLPILKIIHSQKPWFNSFEQNDAHEFLLLFLDILLLSKSDCIEYSWKNFLKNNNKSLIKLYYGELETTIKCNNCNKSNKTFYQFNSINLNIPSEKREYSLAELFHCFFVENNIDFKCEHCENEKNISKKESIYRLPDNLIIVLNRYSSKGYKNNTPIQIPLVLSITEKKTGIIKEYSLKGVINHFGMLLSGHYNSIIKKNDEFYLIDDNSLNKININKDYIFNSNSYILFYSKNNIN